VIAKDNVGRPAESVQAAGRSLVQVQFNLNKLGLPENATAKDALTEKPIAMQAGRIGVELPTLGWAILWLK
jgi:hypothetical protein